jgi:hypothetical protein
MLEHSRSPGGTNEYPFTPDEADFTAVLMDARTRQLTRLEVLRLAIEALGLDWILTPPGG